MAKAAEIAGPVCVTAWKKTSRSPIAFRRSDGAETTALESATYSSFALDVSAT
jgi:hypothetical protein